MIAGAACAAPRNPYFPPMAENALTLASLAPLSLQNFNKKLQNGNKKLPNITI